MPHLLYQDHEEQEQKQEQEEEQEEEEQEATLAPGHLVKTLNKIGEKNSTKAVTPGNRSYIALQQVNNCMGGYFSRQSKLSIVQFIEYLII